MTDFDSIHLRRAVLLVASVFCASTICFSCNAPAFALQGLDEPVSRDVLQRNLDELKIDEVKNDLQSLAPEDRLEWIDSLRQAEWTVETSETQLPMGGGGALPNFGQLIQLIENTIDGNWASEGGSSTIMPFQNGVKVNAEGVLSRVSKVDLDEQARIRGLRPSIDWKRLGKWQTPSELRWVSLGSLNELIRVTKKSEGNVPNDGIVLGGICRIDYLAWDDSSKTWLVGGPAGDMVMNDDGELVHRTLHLPPVLLEDLIAVGTTILKNGAVFGCSIDPDETRLMEAYQFAQSPESMSMFLSKPKSWVDAWKNKLGNQYTRVFGIPAQTTTALALVIADAEMKRMALEFDPLPPGVRSYWKETDLLNRSPQSPIIRWWFTLGDSKIAYDKDRQIYRIPPTNLSVMTESQFYNLAGIRAATASPDIAADAFAKNFTQNSQTIQRTSIAQGRLKHIMDLAVVFELIRLDNEANRRTQLSDLLPDSLPANLSHSPSSIESIASSHVMPNGTRVAIASGGVTIDVTRTAQRLTWGKSELREILLPAFPVVKRGAVPETEPVTEILKLDNAEEPSSARAIQFWLDAKAAN